MFLNIFLLFSVKSLGKIQSILKCISHLALSCWHRHQWTSWRQVKDLLQQSRWEIPRATSKGLLRSSGEDETMEGMVACRKRPYLSDKWAQSEEEAEGKASGCNPHFLDLKEKLWKKLVSGSYLKWSSVFHRLSYIWGIQVKMLKRYLENIDLGFIRTVVRGAIGMWAVVEAKEWWPCHVGRLGGMNEENIDPREPQERIKRWKIKERKKKINISEIKAGEILVIVERGNSTALDDPCCL